MSRQGGWDPPPEDKLRASAERSNRTIKFGAQPLAPARADGAAVAPPNDGAAGYRLGARLGQAGEVYEAQSPRFEGRLAMKLYRRATGLGPEPVEGFARDAARASSLRHPHIAHVIETGTLRDGTPFATTEYLTGYTLEEQLARRGAFLATELLPTIRGVVSALSAAHAAGVVHRELRPDNIFIAALAGYESGFVKVLDFGASHLTAAQWSSGRQLGMRATRYFAPEQTAQARLQNVDARADQFALAAIAYRMLSGTEAPATSGGTPAAGTSISTGLGGGAFITPLARRAPSVDAVVSKALSRSPGDRFESVALFLRAFEEALAGAAMIATPGPARAATEMHGAQHASAIATAGPEYDAPVVPGRRDNERAVDQPSLTQQFFDEGERQEATRYRYAPPDPAEVSASSLDFQSFDRVPKRRTPLVAAVFVTMIGLAGLAWWAGLRPPLAWRQSWWWQQLHLPDSAMDGEGDQRGQDSTAAANALPGAEGAKAPPAVAGNQVAQSAGPVGGDDAGQRPDGALSPTPSAVAAVDAAHAASGAPASQIDGTPAVPALNAPAAPDVIAPTAAPEPQQASPPSGTAGERDSGRPAQRAAPRRRSTAPERYTSSPVNRRSAPQETSEPWPTSESRAAPPLPPADSRPGPPPFLPVSPVSPVPAPAP